VLAAVGVCVAGCLLVGAYLYSEQLGLRGELAAPRWFDAFLQRDSIAYTVHTALGTGLNWVSADPSITEEQWIKAAVHARTRAESEQVAEGLRTVWQRHSSPEGFADRVCWQLRGVKRPATVDAEELAGIHCDIMAGRAKPR
jgi:hypothetical protein